MAQANPLRRGKGKYAIIRRIRADGAYSLWNGTNNGLLTDQKFATARLAREWAEEHGYELRFTSATRKHYEEAHADATEVPDRP